jgi:Histidine kinase-, DNA gyrase B-, and HSP90-like ATPase
MIDAVTSEQDYDLAEPRASAMIESLRAFGYSVQTALADLIDNSISAGAHNVWLEFFWDGAQSHISLRDDGRGMTEPELVDAMRPGNRNPLEVRDRRDLGRFGLGLKTASFSQCRCLTVASRASGNAVGIRQWDLDYVQETGEWRLRRSALPGSEHLLTGLERVDQGTIVLWQNLDRLVAETSTDDQKAHDRFLEMVDQVHLHLAMVFHRFLERRDRLQLHINGRLLEPWDPFMAGEDGRQVLPEETLWFNQEPVKVRPFVLPHHSRITRDVHERGSGPGGWNAQQGFYVYRNERLLVAGDWLGLGFVKEEHYKLARIQVDLPNAMDAAWDLDVKKSRAQPPGALRSDLKRLAKLTRQKAMDVYRHRGKIAARVLADSHVFVWQSRAKHGRHFYTINREHPVVREVLRLAGPDSSVFKTLLRLIEETVPVERIWIDAAENPDGHAQPFERDTNEDVAKVMRAVFQVLLTSGMSAALARQRLATMEPFNQFPAILEDLIEPEKESINP